MKASDNEVQAVMFLGALGAMLGSGISMTNPSIYALPLYGAPVVLGAAMAGFVLAFIAGCFLVGVGKK